METWTRFFFKTLCGSFNIIRWPPPFLEPEASRRSQVTSSAYLPAMVPLIYSQQPSVVARACRSQMLSVLDPH
jgi:hypothetical protein